MQRLALPLLWLCAATACGDPLPDESHLDRTRILAVSASTWAPTPGEPVEMESLSWAPQGMQAVIWRLCLNPEGCEEAEGLALELAGLDWEALPPEDQAAIRNEATLAGIVGAEPGFPVVWALPPGLPEGLPLFLQLEGVPAEGEDVETAIFAPNLEGTPNAPPSLTGLLLDGQAVDLSGPLVVEAETPLSFTLEATDPEGGTLSLSWFTDVPRSEAGGFGGDAPGFLAGLDWGVTLSPGSGDLIVVARDASGAQNWLQIPIQAQ